ncbi:MAG: gfo/Idh/MocA family oxidoreductase, partial [Bacteroidota bacterium]
PIGRKDMEVYGVEGVVYADNRHDLRVRLSTGYDTYDEEIKKLGEREAPLHDPFSFFAAVIHGEIELPPNDLSGLNNNLLVVEILEAAKESARLGSRVNLK